MTPRAAACRARAAAGPWATSPDSPIGVPAAAGAVELANKLEGMNDGQQVFVKNATSTTGIGDRGCIRGCGQ